MMSLEKNASSIAHIHNKMNTNLKIVKKMCFNIS